MKKIKKDKENSKCSKLAMETLDNMWNLFKLINKGTRTTKFFLADFGQVNASWINSLDYRNFWESWKSPYKPKASFCFKDTIQKGYAMTLPIDICIVSVRLLRMKNHAFILFSGS